MSRIGKSPITIPEGVTVTVENAVVKVAGPKGELEQSYDTAISIDNADNVITLTRPSETKDHRSKHGLYRALINNMIEGVTKGFVKELELYGVGFRAQSQGQQLTCLLYTSDAADE